MPSSLTCDFHRMPLPLVSVLGKPNSTGGHFPARLHRALPRAAHNRHYPTSSSRAVEPDRPFGRFKPPEETWNTVAYHRLAEEGT